MVLLRARLIGGLPADLVGSLTGLTQGRFPVQAKAMYANEVKRADLEDDKGTPAYVVDSEARARRHPHLRQEGRAGRRRQRRPHRRHRPLPPPRQLREAPGRLRQHVHVRPPRLRRPALPRPARPHGHRRREARRAQAPAARRRPRRPGLDDQRGGGRRAQGRARGARRARRPRTPRPPTRPGCPPSSACSPTPSARAPRPPAASSRRSSTARTSAPTSTASSASTAPTST